MPSAARVTSVIKIPGRFYILKENLSLRFLFVTPVSFYKIIYYNYKSRKSSLRDNIFGSIVNLLVFLPNSRFHVPYRSRSEMKEVERSLELRYWTQKE